ncbi:peptidoglycan-binding domain-containing protein [Streptomyces sp. QTS137]
MLKVRGKRSKSAVATGVFLAGLVSGALAGAPSATAADYLPCTTGKYLYNKVTNPTSYKYVPYAGTSNHCWLKSGMSNTAVRALQKNLNNCYGKNLALDGVFGSLTKSALVSVQKKVGVTADGEYGPNTRNAMVWANYSMETGAKINCN